MDYIESAPGSQNDPIQIPCLSHEPYDGEDFPKYPERAGWDIDRLLAGDFSQHPAEPTGAFLQNWLYFGVLWEVFGPITRGAKKNYVMPQEGTMYGIITIAALDVQILQLLSSITSMVEIAMVEKTFTSASAYYVSQMERPPSAVQRDHGECTGKLCFARQINEATYLTAHTTAECDCQHLGPSNDEVVSIIASGGVPLMSITPMKKEPYLKVEVQK
ncbi:uncharacterized protein N7529_003466 [Penicillium soppii]|uniref:uncharacterized protein n=1 Tax=Penicillium soppii TaxID=69789 RepID=UPI0025489C7A|nr:uncharacterized protein N7529_003466 [Penicillium soppii]KAJ5871113.1 hypothetical protein N7529_003466 [Penicillium soppii]